METQAIYKAEPGSSPADMIRLAVSGGADLEKLSKLLDIQERWESNESRKAYYSAMAAFKANAPKILKDKKVGYESKAGGKVGYSHASLYNVTQTISAELSKHGLSASWRVAQNGTISVTTRITHILGHFEETTLSAQADTSGSKNSIQAIGSTITYLERYGLLAMTGLATQDQDDDGTTAHDEPITEEQMIAIKEYLTACEVDASKLLKYLKVDAIENIMQSQYAKAISALKAKEKKK